jgi:hypothetical protein
MHDYQQDFIDEVNAELTAEGHGPIDPAYLPPPGYWDVPHTHVQLYEDDTEGTPLSPVFASEAELTDWLVRDGGPDGPLDRTAAEKFVELRCTVSEVEMECEDGRRRVLRGTHVAKAHLPFCPICGKATDPPIPRKPVN